MNAAIVNYRCMVMNHMAVMTRICQSWSTCLGRTGLHYVIFFNNYIIQLNNIYFNHNCLMVPMANSDNSDGKICFWILLFKCNIVANLVGKAALSKRLNACCIINGLHLPWVQACNLVGIYFCMNLIRK